MGRDQDTSLGQQNNNKNVCGDLILMPFSPTNRNIEEYFLFRKRMRLLSTHNYQFNELMKNDLEGRYDKISPRMRLKRRRRTWCVSLLAALFVYFSPSLPSRFASNVTRLFSLRISIYSIHCLKEKHKHRKCCYRCRQILFLLFLFRTCFFCSLRAIAEQDVR